jgi:TrkA-C domain
LVYGLLSARRERTHAAVTNASVSFTQMVMPIEFNYTLTRASRSDGLSIVGWIDNRDVMKAFAARLGHTIEEAEQGALAAEWASAQPISAAHRPRNPLPGYRLFNLVVSDDATTRLVRDVRWPASTLLVAVRRNRSTFTATGDTELRAGDRLTVLGPVEHSYDVFRDLFDGALFDTEDRATA